jgi:alpha-glucosidase
MNRDEPSNRPEVPPAGTPQSGVMTPDRSPSRPSAAFCFGDDWWQRGVVYQIYPRSFADGNGDGVGDLAGLMARLDDLNDGSERSLGVDAIWLSPIYPSPGFDVGYDVADYTDIDRLFGSLADFDRLIDEAHARGIRVILDMVLNHSSSQHPWFVASRSSRDDPQADWYIWRDAAGRDWRGRPRRPNNWVSFFGGPAWTWDERRGQFYLHTFLPEQPDLNWRHPAVRNALLDVVRFWLARGVDGFRFDVFNAFYKHLDLPSNPRRFPGGRRAYSRQEHQFDKNQPDLQGLLAEVRSTIDAVPGRMTVGELFEGPPALAAAYTAPRHLVFDFRLIEQPWRASAFARAIEERERAFGQRRWPTVVLSNHDRSRHASRFDHDGFGDARARVAAVLLLTLRGTPFLYYGEEIGLRDVPIPPGEAVDPPARRSGLLSPWWNRDQARAPMPWSAGPNAGFTTGPPWLRMAADGATRNVARQAADPGSLLSLYRRLVWLRRTLPALQVGGMEWAAKGTDGALAYVRRTAGQTLLVALNFERRPVVVRLAEAAAAGRWRTLVSTHEEPREGLIGSRLSLRPLEAIVFEAE